MVIHNYKLDETYSMMAKKSPIEGEEDIVDIVISPEAKAIIEAIDRNTQALKERMA